MYNKYAAYEQSAAQRRQKGIDKVDFTFFMAIVCFFGLREKWRVCFFDQCKVVKSH